MNHVAVRLTCFLLLFMTNAAFSQKRFLALGDSYTIGEAAEESERWPMQLTKELNIKGISVATPEILAKTGWTTDELLVAVKEYSFQPPYDVVSLLIGVNNQYRSYSKQTYQAEFEELLKYAISLAGGEAGNILVLSIPDWGSTPFAEGRDRNKIAMEIEEFNQINKAISEKFNVLWVDIFEISRLAKSNSTLTAADGLHPSAEMYSLWTKEILKNIRHIKSLTD